MSDDDNTLFDAILKYIPEGLTIAEAPDVNIVAVSRFGKDLLGKGDDELTGQTAETHPATWQVYHLDGKTLASADELPLTRATKNGEIIVNEPWLLRTKNGDDIEILCNAGPIRDLSGKIRWGIIAWRDVTALRKAERALEEERQKTLQYKDALLKEINHRVKNNLSIVTSLLSMQSRKTSNEEARVQLREAAERIYALSGLYGHLSKSSKNDLVEVSAYISDICQGIEKASKQPDRPLTISVSADCCQLASERAANLGIGLNELVMNACKHGHSEDGSCTVEVSFRVEDGHAQLTVSDRGKGIPEGFNPDTANGIGMRLIRSIVSQLDGSLSLTPQSCGLKARIRFPIPKEAHSGQPFAAF